MSTDVTVHLYHFIFYRPLYTKSDQTNMTSTYIQPEINAFFFAALALFTAACAHTEAVEAPAQPVQRSKEFNDYWHKGEVEVSSYRLEQARYGGLRQGEAV